jgi:hypothetical protein
MQDRNQLCFAALERLRGSRGRRRDDLHFDHISHGCESTACRINCVPATATKRTVGDSTKTLPTFWTKATAVAATLRTNGTVHCDSRIDNPRLHFQTYNMNKSVRASPE